LFIREENNNKVLKFCDDTQNSQSESTKEGFKSKSDELKNLKQKKKEIKKQIKQRELEINKQQKAIDKVKNKRDKVELILHENPGIYIENSLLEEIAESASTDDDAQGLSREAKNIMKVLDKISEAYEKSQEQINIDKLKYINGL
jgi:uncharacterized protein YdiU (UPF0061 family)